MPVEAPSRARSSPATARRPRRFGPPPPRRRRPASRAEPPREPLGRPRYLASPERLRHSEDLALEVTSMSMQSINPATGEVLETFTETPTEQVERILAAAHAAFLEWRQVPLATRAQPMRKAAGVLRSRRAEFARTMALEMGKPVVQGEAEVDKCAWTCDFYAEHADAYLAPQPRATDASQSYVRFDPLGTVLAVMPWNFPFWQVVRFAAPALMAGNAAILKHASNVPRCALQLEELFREAGFPRGLFATVLVGSSTVPGLIADPRIAAVTLTGSDRAGSQVAERAGRQSRADLRDALHAQVEGSVKRGARRVIGGEVPPGRGAFYPPTLLAAVDRGMPAFDEETFGPVAAVVRAKDDADAVRLANDSVFGLGASLWTQDRARAERLATQIEAGAGFVHGPVKAGPRPPLGGIKRSGYGRELSEYGIREFVNIKTVWIA